MSILHNIFNVYKYRKTEEKVYDIANIICFFGMLILSLFFYFMNNDIREMFITLGVAILFIITLVGGNRTNKRHSFAIIMTIIFNFAFAPHLLYIHGISTQFIMFCFLFGIIYTLCLNEFKAALVLSIVELSFSSTYLYLILSKSSVNNITNLDLNYKIAYCLNAGIFIFVILCAGAAVRVGVLILDRETEKYKIAYEEAFDQQNAKDIFLLNISHEIRTPMNAIVGNSNLLLDEDINDNVREYTYQIINSCNALLLILDELMELAKFDEKDINIEINEYDLCKLIREIVNIINVKLIESNLKFVINVNHRIPRYLIGDYSRIRQVVINILNNAIKYTQSGEICLDIDYKPDKENRIILFISIKDTGIGISDADLEFIFDDNHKYEGFEDNYGIGLVVCKSIIDKMSGEILVSSKLGVGSEFIIELPQSYNNYQKVDNMLNDIDEYSFYQNEIESDFVIPGINILIVDDNYTNLDVASSLLKKYEANIFTASNGMDAIRILNDKKMDIVFLDYMMPELNGIDTLNIIRSMENKEYEKVPVIALSANAVSGAKELFERAGFDGFLAKPISVSKLKKVILSYIPKECIKKK